VQNSKTAGITITELIITITIIGIVSAIAAPPLRRWIGERRDEAGLMVLWRTFQQGRVYVAKDDADLLISFDIVNNNFTAYIDENANGIGETSEIIVDGTRDTLIFGVPVPAPSSPATGVSSLTPISIDWKNNGITIRNNSTFSINEGHIYLRNRAYPELGYCIVVRERSNRAELLKWGGSKWFQM